MGDNMDNESLDRIVLEQTTGLGVFLNKLEGQENIDWDTVRAYINKINRLIYLLGGNVKYRPKRFHSSEVKKGIIKALEKLYEIELEIQRQSPENKGLVSMSEFQVTASDIKEIIINLELCSLDSFNSNFVESEIGRILNSLGFTGGKRTNRGKLRRIDTKHLNKYIQGEIVLEDDIKPIKLVIPPVEDNLKEAIRKTLNIIIKENKSKEGKVENRIIEKGKQKGQTYSVTWGGETRTTVKEIKDTMIKNNLYDEFKNIKGINYKIANSLSDMGFDSDKASGRVGYDIDYEKFEKLGLLDQ